MLGFTGRADELRRLDESLTGDGTAAITVVSGAPGVGKTAVAVRWAHRVSDRFPDGQLYVNLRGFDTTSPVPAHQALDAFVRAFDVAPERIPTQVDELAALYRSLLASRRVLVVLDNAADVDQVRPLLPGSATCAVVVTSRNRLAGLSAGAGAQRVALEALSPVDSVALLRATVGSDRLDAEPEAAAGLAQLCAGLPLALRIAGERVAGSRHHALADLVEQLAAEHDRLDLLAAVDDQVDVVRAAFSWSYRKLPAPAAGMFRRLSWHAGPEFGVPAAAALADLPEPKARRVLEALAGANLLTEVGRERYRFHDLVRLYALERAEAEETAIDRTAAVRRLLEWFLRMADAADHQLTRRSYCVTLAHTGADEFFPDQRRAIQWCELERVNLKAAIRQASDSGEHSIAWRLPVALWGFFFLNKHMEDWTSALTIGLASAKEARDRRGEAWILHALRETRFSMHEAADASGYPREALAIFLDIGDQWGVREALSNLGYSHRLLGQPEQALVHLNDALTLWRQTEDLWGRAWTLHSLGETYLDLRRWDEAAQALDEALHLFARIEHRQAEGFAMSNLGYVLLGTEQFASAIDQFHQAMAVHDEVGDRWSTSRSMTGLGIALHATGNTEDADRYWHEALAISEDLQDRSAAERIRALLTG
ncbi:ATP-binding protein [Actinosynnema sp. NPDC059335]|uniref:ATP-binding protein n=1 Tax=Actinosynnema sp. NPDC059335 TaxID=3346804 RepID=UPI00366A73BA